MTMTEASHVLNHRLLCSSGKFYTTQKNCHRLIQGLKAFYEAFLIHRRYNFYLRVETGRMLLKKSASIDIRFLHVFKAANYTSLEQTEIRDKLHSQAVSKDDMCTKKFVTFNKTSIKSICGRTLRR